MFFLATIQTENVIEMIRVNDPVQVCAKQQLKSECKSFDFGLDQGFRYASDLQPGMEKLRLYNSLQCWNKFFDALFPARSSSESMRRKCDVIFQVIFNIINAGQRKTPLHTAIAQSIHDTCKSKNLIQIFNRLGLCISYDDLERVDMCQTQQLIDLASPCRVPVPENIDSSSIIHGAMDNFLTTRKTRYPAFIPFSFCFKKVMKSKMMKKLGASLKISPPQNIFLYTVRSMRDGQKYAKNRARAFSSFSYIP